MSNYQAIFDDIYRYRSNLEAVISAENELFDSSRCLLNTVFELIIGVSNVFKEVDSKSYIATDLNKDYISQFFGIELTTKLISMSLAKQVALINEMLAKFESCYVNTDKISDLNKIMELSDYPRFNIQTSSFYQKEKGTNRQYISFRFERTSGSSSVAPELTELSCTYPAWLLYTIKSEYDEDIDSTITEWIYVKLQDFLAEEFAKQEEESKKQENAELAKLKELAEKAGYSLVKNKSN